MHRINHDFETYVETQYASKLPIERDAGADALAEAAMQKIDEDPRLHAGSGVGRQLGTAAGGVGGLGG